LKKKLKKSPERSHLAKATRKWFVWGDD